VWGNKEGSFDIELNQLGYYGVRVNGPVLKVPRVTMNVTDFDDGTEGQHLTVWFFGNGGTTTVEHNANIVLTGGIDVDLAADAFMQFVNMGDVWYQV
jgi:hypothetical protein